MIQNGMKKNLNLIHFVAASDNMIKEFTGLLCDWTVNEMKME